MLRQIRKLQSRSRPAEDPAASAPIRLLTAVPLCDGHDSAISTINLELIRHGMEVIYLGYNRSVREIVRAAIQEDVRAIGISSYNGGHVEFFGQVKSLLKHAGAGHIGLFGGGGGTISRADAAVMARHGTDRIFFAGTPLGEMVEWVIQRYGHSSRGTDASTSHRSSDVRLARELSEAGRHHQVLKEPSPRPSPGVPGEGEKKTPACPVIGFTGPGGAGKTTIIDELVFRFLSAQPKGRVGILSHDPSLAGHGALLGDRATMIWSQDDRVFMRSLATRGRMGGLAPETEACLQIMRHAGFDLVLVETVGTGQEASPFSAGMVDQRILVMSPQYGSPVQLQKIAMLDSADVVVVNKSDMPGAKTALAEIDHRLGGGVGPRLIPTIAKQHRDPGVGELFRQLTAGITCGAAS